MPVWHKLTEEARKSDLLTIVGVIQEQHVDRCRLFAQWHQMDWTILGDPINHLNATAVPMFVAIDESGVVVDSSLQPNELEAFLQRPKPPKSPAPAAPRLSREEEITLTRDTGRISNAIKSYKDASTNESPQAADFFRLGVAYRMRFDSSLRQAEDFQLAADAWSEALERNPNQYIYRRRIQQYGPRLIKPYPFYDWVPEARRDILARGEEPVALSVEPSGAEFASRSREFFNATATESVDPKGRIARDLSGLIHATTTVVPAIIQPGEAVRVHVELKPNGNAHWNNEVEPTLLWIGVPAGWSISENALRSTSVKAAESTETRRLEFELRTPADLPATSDSTQLHGYALYYVCSEINGQCLYLRQDISFSLHFRR